MAFPSFAQNSLTTSYPIEATNALYDIQRELQDIKRPRIKDESLDVHVKTESLKREDEPYAPSKTFRSTIQQLQQARMTGAAEGLPDISISNSNVKPEEEQPSAPSEAFVAAIRKIQSVQAPQASAHERRSYSLGVWY